MDKTEAARIARQAAAQLRKPHREYTAKEVDNLKHTVEYMRALAKGK
jgi:hypothetical protein